MQIYIKKQTTQSDVIKRSCICYKTPFLGVVYSLFKGRVYVILFP